MSAAGFPLATTDTRHRLSQDRHHGTSSDRPGPAPRHQLRPARTGTTAPAPTGQDRHHGHRPGAGTGRASGRASGGGVGISSDQASTSSDRAATAPGHPAGRQQPQHRPGAGIGQGQRRQCRHQLRHCQASTSTRPALSRSMAVSWGHGWRAPGRQAWNGPAPTRPAAAPLAPGHPAGRRHHGTD